MEEKECVKCGDKFLAEELCEIKMTKEGVKYYDYDYDYDEICDDCKLNEKDISKKL